MIWSCNKKIDASIKEKVNSFLGKTIILTEDYSFYNPDSVNINAFQNSLKEEKYKVFTLINASCSTCVEQINEWQRLSLEFKKYNVPIALICFSKDNFELLKFLYESGSLKKFNTPLILDLNQKFLNTNKFLIEEKHFSAALVNHENEIILIGNPIFSQGIKKMYQEELQKYLKE